MSWLIGVLLWVVVGLAFVLASGLAVVGFVVALLVSVPLWGLVWLAGRLARRDEGMK